MAGLTLEQAQAQLAAYLAAEAAVLQSQEYELGGRRLRRADLRTIQAGITLWNERVQSLSARASGRRRAVVPTPRF
jgi:hypothetical protein